MPSAPVLALVPLLLVAGCLAPTATDPATPPPGVPEERAWPAVADALVRPGDKLRPREVDPQNLSIRGCTLGFVLLGVDDRAVYLTTSSHCLNGVRVGSTMHVSGEVRATLVYCSWGASDGSATCTTKTGDDPDRPDDLALLRVDAADVGKVHPAVRVWGGPTALSERPPDAGRVVRTYGNSYLRDAGSRAAPDALDARQGVVEGADAWATRVRFEGPRTHGDSGSPVVDEDGLAVGLVRTLDGATNSVMNLAPALASMEARGGPRVTLATAPPI